MERNRLLPVQFRVEVESELKMFGFMRQSLLILLETMEYLFVTLFLSVMVLVWPIMQKHCWENTVNAACIVLLVKCHRL